MTNPRLKKLKQRYEDVRAGLDGLQEEVLARGMELRPTLRRQFEEALRGLFYSLACADGRIDPREVRFYNELFDEQLSVATFELVRSQLERSHHSFDEDFLATVAGFAAYDKSLTGKMPLGAPSLSTLLISAATAVGNMVIASDGEVDERETAALEELIERARQRAQMVASDAETLLQDGVSDGHDPDAEVTRDIRAVQRLVCVTLTEAVYQAADIVVESGLGKSDSNSKTEATAARFVAGEVREDLERGKASTDLVTLAATQVPVVSGALAAVLLAGDEVQPGWRDLAEEALRQLQAVVDAVRDVTDARVRTLREKHRWSPDVIDLEEGLQDVWEIIDG